MMNNCNYDKIKLMHDLTNIAWFVEQFCKKDAATTGHKDCAQLYQQLQEGLEKHLKALCDELKKSPFA